ncbi:MAG: hypothetical protein ACRD4C_05160 [Candidatus Acidiferrales bacterium]
MSKNAHNAALATGVFDTATVRTRAERREHYVIADGHPENSSRRTAKRTLRGKATPRTGKTPKQKFMPHSRKQEIPTHAEAFSATC